VGTTMSRYERVLTLRRSLKKKSGKGSLGGKIALLWCRGTMVGEGSLTSDGEHFDKFWREKLGLEGPGQGP